MEREGQREIGRGRERADIGWLGALLPCAEAHLGASQGRHKTRRLLLLLLLCWWQLAWLGCAWPPAHVGPREAICTLRHLPAGHQACLGCREWICSRLVSSRSSGGLCRLAATGWFKGRSPLLLVLLI